MSEQLVAAIVAFVFGGGLVGGVIAFIKVGPERQQLAVTTAEKAASAAGGVIDDLVEQGARQERQIVELAERLRSLENENTELRSRVAGLELERDNLREQVRILEGGMQ
ncbi:MAG TPA: hypothetical protein VFQ40_08495 [Actinomycetota bacterium]|nr:hypothetical protein [Actinomycetota bacterium]